MVVAKNIQNMTHTFKGLQNPKEVHAFRVSTLLGTDVLIVCRHHLLG